MAIISTPCEICGRIFHEDTLLSIAREDLPNGDYCPRCTMDSGAIDDITEPEMLRWYTHTVGYTPDERGEELRSLVAGYIEAMIEEEN